MALHSLFKIFIKLKNINIFPTLPSIDGIEFTVPASDICSLFTSIKIKTSNRNLSYSNQISVNFLRREYRIISDLFNDPSSQIQLLNKLLRNYENDANIYPNDKKMANYSESLKLILSYFEGQPIEITADNIMNISEISSSLKHVSLQKVSNIFIDVQSKYKKIKELIKIESQLSKIDENNIEKTKFQLIQSFLTKEQKYHNLLIDILIYYSKIRPNNIKFYIQLIESLIQNKTSNKKTVLTSQIPETKLTMTLNKKRIIKPQIKPVQKRQKFSSSLQFTSNKTEIIETNDFSNLLIKELQNSRIKKYYTNYFLFRLFSNSVITTKKQKLSILNFVKESNSDELKEWFSSSLKTLSKEQIDLYNKYTTYLNEEPIREAIRNDNISDVKSILNSKNKSTKDYIEKNVLNNKIIFDFLNKKENKSIYLTEYAAVFGSINCFKYFVSNNFKLPSNIIKKAIHGGNIEIINLCIEKGFKINNKLLNTTIKYHQNKVFKYFINSCGIQIPKNPFLCIQTYNFKAIFKNQMDNFNCIFELINYNNILLIELMSPYIHSFIKLIMAYYSIINHSNEIAEFLYNSIDEIRYPSNFLKNINENDVFNSIIKSCKQDKFEKEIVFILFCFINDNVDFLKIVLPSKEKSKSAFKALFLYGGFLFKDYKLTLCQKYIFSLIPGFINEEKFLSLFQDSDKNSIQLQYLLFEQFNTLHLKFTKSQLDFIMTKLLIDQTCRSIILKNYSNYISNESIEKLIEYENIDIFYELTTTANIDINFVLTQYLNRLSLKFRPDSRAKRTNTTLMTTRRLTTSFNERENDKKIINLCSSHHLFDINYEVDEDRNSYLHLIVMNDLDYILRFIFTNPVFKQILNKCNKFNKTAFLMAVEYRNIECSQILIDQNGINTSISDVYEMNALNYAIQNNLNDLVMRLIENKKRNKKNAREKNDGENDVLNFVSKNKHISPICCSNSPEMINLIISKGAKSATFNGIDKDGLTLLVKSLDRGNLLDYKFILNNLKGIDINAKCRDGKTFIMKAIELNEYQTIVDFIDKQLKTTDTNKTETNQNKIETNTNKTETNPNKYNANKAETNLNRLNKIEANPKKINSNKAETNSNKIDTNSYDIDFSILSKENSYLASSIKANNFDLIDKFLPNSIKNGNDQAALLESMKQKGTNYSSITSKLVSTYKKKLELTPMQLFEYLPEIPEKFYDFILKNVKDPNKVFNFVYNDQTVLISSILNNNVSLFKFLVSNSNLIDLNYNWSNSQNLNCFDFSVQNQRKEMTEILFKEAKINKSVDSFIKTIIHKNKFTCSLKLDETIKKNWISEILKKKKDQIFIEIVENNNIDLFSLIINDIDKECLINKAFEIAASKRFDFILNSLIENRMLNSDNAIQISIAQNNAALLKSLLQKFNECINMNKFIEFVLSSNQNIQNIYLSYAQISDYTKKLLKNENDFYFDASNVNNLLQLAK